MQTVYTELTRRFNSTETQAILAGGQAAVLHHIAFMSKDGDWIIRERSETVTHILAVLSEYGAGYRFGAPLDTRWLSAGWSAHLEFQHQDLRVRTDFVTRPPRFDAERLKRLWQETATNDLPFAPADQLAEMKKTNREKDYVVIGELARRMPSPQDQLRYSRSARDLSSLARQYPEWVEQLTPERPLLAVVSQGRDALEQALDAERRQLIRANEVRLEKYLRASQSWQAVWPALSRQMRGYPLLKAHQLMVQQAEKHLPFSVPGGWP